MTFDPSSPSPFPQTIFVVGRPHERARYLREKVLPRVPIKRAAIDLLKSYPCVSSWAGEVPLPRAPDHTISMAALVGTPHGRPDWPSEITIASYGVFYFNPVTDFTRAQIEAVLEAVSRGKARDGKPAVPAVVAFGMPLR